MPLTTVARGRVYEWSHAVGRGAQSGTGLNYPQTMCLAKGGVAYVANRGNENHFVMRYNELKIDGPGGESIAHGRKLGRDHDTVIQPWGIAIDQAGNTYVADGKNHRVYKLSPQGKFMMKTGEYGTVPVAPGAYAVSYMGPYILSSGTPGYPKAGLLNHPTDVAVDTDGDIYVADWGNHRVCVFDAEGGPIANLIGDAQVMSKWA